MAHKPPSIADSTDWIQTALPQLTSVDASLRCQVCKDFFTTPVITSCAHTFCSLCIRRCLAADGRCPACRAQDQPSKLRRNGALEEAVDAFVVARPKTLEIARVVIKIADGAGAGANGDRDEAGHTGGTGGNSKPMRKAVAKRKLEDLDVENEQGQPPTQTRKTRSQSRRSAPDTPKGGSPKREVVVLDDEVPVDNSGDDGEYQPEDGLVPCPICGTRMKEEAVFPHLDMCGRQERAQTTSSFFGKQPQKQSPASSHRDEIGSPATPPPAYLPHLNYSLLSDTALRKKLKDVGIPSWGTRQLLMSRHTEWANLWNANCDSNRPRSKKELLADLDAWERSQGGLTSGSAGQSQLGSTGGGTNNVTGRPGQARRDSGSEVMTKDFDGAGWGKRNREQFEDLISAARKGRQAKPRATSTPEAGHASGDGSGSTPQEGARSGDDIAQPAAVSGNSVTSDSGRLSLSQPDGYDGRLAKETKEFKQVTNATETSPEPTALPARIATTGTKKMPMFQVSEDPIVDLDGDTTAK